MLPRNMDVRRSLTMLGVTMLGGTLVMGGCASSGDSEEALIRENGELRQRVVSLQSALDEAGARYAALEDENDRLAGNLDDARQRGMTGFDGIDGVSASRTASGDVVVAIAGDVLFASGKVDLRNDAKATLQRVAGVLNSTYATNAIRVEGYTDTDPIRKSKWVTNERLSAERAMAVENFLVSLGVDNERIYSAAFGPARQKGSKKDSRRVEIVVLAGSY